MKDKDLFKEVFSDKLKEHAVDVNPNLWNAVSSQIASSGAAAGGTALGIGAKVIIGVAVAASLGTAAFFITKEDTHSPTNIAQNEVENVLSEKEDPTQTKTAVVADETIEQVANEELEEVVSNLEPAVDETTEIIESTSESSEDTHNTEENAVSSVNSGGSPSVKEGKVGGNQTKFLSSKPSTEDKNKPAVDEAHVELSYTIIPTLKNGVYNFKIKGDDFETVEWNFGNEEYSLQKEANYFYKTPGRKIVKAIVVQGDVVKELETTVEVKIAGKFIEVPTAFTPNNDGSNDYYRVKTVDIAEFTVRIVDINQNLVYQSEEVDFTWDGIAMDGSLAPEGTYRIIIIGKDVNGYPINYQGAIELKR